MNKKPELIEQRTWSGKQSRSLRIIRKISDFRLKIEVQRDSYDEQSYARAHVWSPASLSWNPVADIPAPEMSSVARGSRYSSPGVDADLQKDADVLLDLARRILLG